MFLKVLLKCEQIDNGPSITPEVHDICPAPLETIEEKLDALSAKVEDIQQALEDCSGNNIEEYVKEEEQGKIVENREVMLFRQKILYIEFECLTIFQ